MSNIDSSVNAENYSKATFADLTESSCLKITELEQKLQEETGENVVLVAYSI